MDREINRINRIIDNYMSNITSLGYIEGFSPISVAENLDIPVKYVLERLNDLVMYGVLDLYLRIVCDKCGETIDYLRVNTKLLYDVNLVIFKNSGVKVLDNNLIMDATDIISQFNKKTSGDVICMKCKKKIDKNKQGFSLVYEVNKKS